MKRRNFLPTSFYEMTKIKQFWVLKCRWSNKCAPWFISQLDNTNYHFKMLQFFPHQIPQLQIQCSQILDHNKACKTLFTKVDLNMKETWDLGRFTGTWAVKPYNTMRDNTEKKLWLWNDWLPRFQSKPSYIFMIKYNK